MEKNMGGADRAVRFVAGLAVVALGFYFKSWWGLLGLVLIATAAIGWCPMYLPFGIKTRGK